MVSHQLLFLHSLVLCDSWTLNWDYRSEHQISFLRIVELRMLIQCNKIIFSIFSRNLRTVWFVQFDIQRILFWSITQNIWKHSGPLQKRGASSDRKCLSKRFRRRIGILGLKCALSGALLRVYSSTRFLASTCCWSRCRQRWSGIELSWIQLEYLG